MLKSGAPDAAVRPIGPGSARGVQKDQTRRKIFDAACDLMAETNFMSTTIDMIARAAGVGRATFYLHFDSKNDIVDEANRIVQARLRALCEELAAWEKPDEDAIIGWMTRLVRAHEEEKTYLRVMTQVYSLDPERNFGGERWHTLIIDTLAPKNQAFGRVRVKRAEHRMLAARVHMILFALERFITCCVLEGGVSDREAGIVVLAGELHAFMNSV